MLKLKFYTPDFPDKVINDFITVISPKEYDSIDFHDFFQILFKSISLGLSEKKRVLDALPKLSEFQYIELIKLFKEESKKFKKLSVKHPANTIELISKSIIVFFCLARNYGVINQDNATERKLIISMLDKFFTSNPQLHTVFKQHQNVSIDTHTIFQYYETRHWVSENNNVADFLNESL
ncbi:MAG: hypothetical protein KGV46_00700 [Pasteurella sp.]|nr:hypothetical protein [Pasteurella sp.]